MNYIEIFKALSNDSRVNILHYLKDPQAHFVHKTGVDMLEVGVCVEEIQRVLHLAQSTTSQYLAVLQRAGLVIPTRRGKWTYYRRNEEVLAALSDYVSKEL